MPVSGGALPRSFHRGRRRGPDWRRVAAMVVLALAFLAARPAAATQEYILPTLFDVADVAADDVLNIRAAPRADAEIIGALAPDARAIEVVAHDRTGRWGQVNTGERSGWVAMRHLAYRTDVWEEGRLPPTLHCLGTEPFWALQAAGEAMDFSTPQTPERRLRLESVLATGVFRDPRRALIATAPDRRLTAVIVPTACSDGMSDRAYGLEASLILEGEGAPEMLTGCCSVSP